jgi:hypothetical protein
MSGRDKIIEMAKWAAAHGRPILYAQTRPMPIVPDIERDNLPLTGCMEISRIGSGEKVRVHVWNAKPWHGDCSGWYKINKWQYQICECGGARMIDYNGDVIWIHEPGQS